MSGFVTCANLTAALATVGGATPDATTTVKGKVELATVAEAAAGTDATRAVTPAGLSAAVAAQVTVAVSNLKDVFNN